MNKNYCLKWVIIVLEKYSYPKKCGAKVQHLIHISEVFPAYLIFNAIITYYRGWRQRKIDMKNWGDENEKLREIKNRGDGNEKNEDVEVHPRFIFCY